MTLKERQELVKASVDVEEALKKLFLKLREAECNQQSEEINEMILKI